MNTTRLLILLLWIPATASAGWINRDGEKLPDSDDRKTVGGFGAQLVLVADDRELFERWAIPSETVDVKTTDQVKVNDFISAFIVFGGCQTNAKGDCDVSMRFRVTQPDGKVYADTPAMEVWENKPAPRGKAIELSVQYLKLRIEPKDPPGRYVVYAQVRDNNTGEVIQLQSPFTASSR